MHQLVLTIALVTIAGQPRTELLSFEIRIFNGAEEVSAQTRVTVHRAGERGEPVAQIPSGSERLQIGVPAGIYDVQAIREREGRVVNIRWAERLVVMPYPDEDGRHLEVINFQNGFGALEVRLTSGNSPDLALFVSGNREKEAGTAVQGAGYMLFVVPAGRYDLRAGAGAGSTWHTSIEVPLDRTRFWVLP